MTPVYQETGTDCLPACIATLLDLPLWVVPNYVKLGPDGQLAATQRWLRRGGWTYVEIPFKKRFVCKMAAPAWCLLNLSYGEKGWVHSVVGRLTNNQIRVVHDPSKKPDNRTPVIETVGFLVPAVK